MEQGSFSRNGQAFGADTANDIESDEINACLYTLYFIDSDCCVLHGTVEK